MRLNLKRFLRKSDNLDFNKLSLVRQKGMFFEQIIPLLFIQNLSDITFAAGKLIVRQFLMILKGLGAHTTTICC